MVKKSFSIILSILSMILIFPINSFALTVYGSYRPQYLYTLDNIIVCAGIMCVCLIVAFGVSFAIMISKRNKLTIEKEEMDEELSDKYLQFNNHMRINEVIFYSLLMAINIILMLIWISTETITVWTIIHVLLCNLSLSKFLQRSTVFAYISLLAPAVIGWLQYVYY